jgi:hypothetical protein
MLEDGSTAKPNRSPKSAQLEEPHMAEEEGRCRRSAQIFYLRHYLQQGFLSPGQAPKHEDMSEHLRQLEQCELHEANLIVESKVCKVLRRVIKLDYIPGDEQYSFKQRAKDFLSRWTRVLAVNRDHTTTIELLNDGVQHHDMETSPVKSKEVKANQENKRSLPPSKNPLPNTSISTTLSAGASMAFCHLCPAKFTGEHRIGNFTDIGENI